MASTTPPVSVAACASAVAHIRQLLEQLQQAQVASRTVEDLVVPTQGAPGTAASEFAHATAQLAARVAGLHAMSGDVRLALDSFLQAATRAGVSIPEGNPVRLPPAFGAAPPAPFSSGLLSSNDVLQGRLLNADVSQLLSTSVGQALGSYSLGVLPSGVDGFASLHGLNLSGGIIGFGGGGSAAAPFLSSGPSGTSGGGGARGRGGERDDGDGGGGSGKRRRTHVHYTCEYCPPAQGGKSRDMQGRKNVRIHFHSKQTFHRDRYIRENAERVRALVDRRGTPTIMFAGVDVCLGCRNDPIQPEHAGCCQTLAGLLTLVLSGSVSSLLAMSPPPALSSAGGGGGLLAPSAVTTSTGLSGDLREEEEEEGGED